MSRFLPITLILLGFPHPADALTIAQVSGVFNLLVGLMLVASLLVFGGGFMMYMARIGTDQRRDGIDHMKQGVRILFVLLVLLAITRFIQDNNALASFIVGIVFVVSMFWVAIQVLKMQKASGEEKA